MLIRHKHMNYFYNSFNLHFYNTFNKYLYTSFTLQHDQNNLLFFVRAITTVMILELIVMWSVMMGL